MTSRTVTDLLARDAHKHLTELKELRAYLELFVDPNDRKDVEEEIGQPFDSETITTANEAHNYLYILHEKLNRLVNLLSS